MTLVVYSPDDPLKRAQREQQEETLRANGGRPRVLIPDMETIERCRRYAQEFCSVRTAARLFGVSERAFQKFRAKYTAVREAWDEGRGRAERVVHSTQVSRALEGSDTMLIWLGKNYLGQTDRREHRHTVELKPIDPNADQKKAAEDYANVMNLPPSLRLVDPNVTPDVVDLEEGEFQDISAEMPSPDDV